MGRRGESAGGAGREGGVGRWAGGGGGRGAFWARGGICRGIGWGPFTCGGEFLWLSCVFEAICCVHAAFAWAAAGRATDGPSAVLLASCSTCGGGVLLLVAKWCLWTFHHQKFGMPTSGRQLFLVQCCCRYVDHSAWPMLCRPILQGPDPTHSYGPAAAAGVCTVL